MRWSCLLLALVLFWRCALVVRLSLCCSGALLLARRAAAKQLVGFHCGFGTERVRTRVQCKCTPIAALQRCAGYALLRLRLLRYPFFTEGQDFFIKKYNHASVRHTLGLRHRRVFVQTNIRRHTQDRFAPSRRPAPRPARRGPGRSPPRACPASRRPGRPSRRGSRL